MATVSTIKSETLQVPGGSLYFEVRGSGPVLLMMPGGPADATTFRRMEERLAADYTVITYDPRGLSQDRKSTRLNSSHANISYAVFCLKKKKKIKQHQKKYTRTDNISTD